MQLNKAQSEAVCHVAGPMLVLAGPGSGKTRVITERIRYLVNEQAVNPDNILVVTFTRAAAMEMRDRYQKTGSKAGVSFGTFHSIFFSVLKSAYGYTSSDIIGEDVKYKFIMQMLSRSGKAEEFDKDMVSDILAEIGKVKSEQYNIEEYYPMSCSGDLFKKIYLEYDRMLKNNRKIDFEDMIIYTHDLFAMRKDILARYQSRYKYILVDEFQDINLAQFKILKMLAEPHNNLFVVGDDDQTIYSFRGSRPEIMLNFQKEYPDVKKVLLDTNYRCSGTIVNAAGRLIDNNEARYKKLLRADNPVGDAIDIKSFPVLKEQNEYVVKLIKDYASKGLSYSDIAVLYRTNVQPQDLVWKLMEYNIPIRLKEGIPNMYEHWIAKDIFAYIKLGMGIRDRDTFMRVMNKPTRYISRAVIDEKTVDFNKLMAVYDDKYWMCERIEQFEADVKAIYKMKPHRGLNYLDKVVGYGDYLEEYAATRGIEADSLREVYEQLYQDAGEYSNYEDWFSHITEVGRFKEQGYKREEEYSDKGEVNLMTLHGSKGLEFDNVIIVDVNETIIPHKMSVKPEEIEEERRLFYVGMTRAKKRLHLCSVKHRYNHDLEVSRFIDEINHPRP